ncbi:hypothetical protein NA57DRAFT_78425 [Rhizodiscina lignyota]|uniref:Casein kinase substrate phosphoprotein PP28 domain-containing protein n=1 Tax=Rhizodiscina lignyota TaxID=1504668 RepID=A0A9P4M4I1_9PEZI|nr:hypothetical protein NA57DRAFT_78425 [Rhizodiscina lignyota]
MSSVNRGRAGKFRKPKRGGGKQFSRDLQPIGADGEVQSMWAEPRNKDGDDSSEDDDDESTEEEDTSDDDVPPQNQQDQSREQRRAAAKARKEAAKAKQQAKPAAPGELPSSSEEDEDDDDDEMPANPNHTAAARTQVAGAEAMSKKAEKKPELSRREREALAAQQAKERYQAMHLAGKTDEARADLARLALIKEKREAEAERKKAEAEERAEREKEKGDENDREKKMRDAAVGSSGKRGGKRGGKK